SNQKNWVFIPKTGVVTMKSGGSTSHSRQTFANERKKDMFIKKTIALALSLALAGAMLAGCQSNTPTASCSGSQASTGAADGEVVHIKLFAGKIETIDVMNEMIEDFNASQDRIVVEQEYQKDASNVIKIKFA